MKKLTKRIIKAKISHPKILIEYMLT